MMVGDGPDRVDAEAEARDARLAGQGVLPRQDRHGGAAARRRRPLPAAVEQRVVRPERARGAGVGRAGHRLERRRTSGGRSRWRDRIPLRGRRRRRHGRRRAGHPSRPRPMARDEQRSRRRMRASVFRSTRSSATTRRSTSTRSLRRPVLSEMRARRLTSARGRVSLAHAIILGIVQGLSEFLPVSSSAHLTLVPWLFHWDDPGLAFDVALHVGTLIAVLWYFRAQWIALARAARRAGHCRRNAGASSFSSSPRSRARSPGSRWRSTPTARFAIRA